MSHIKIVTGCLQKGDEPGEFSITGKDVRTWGVRSNSVKLEQHVGHQVTVTGSAHRESKAQVKAEGKERRSDGERGRQRKWSPDDFEQRPVNFQTAVVINETELSKPIHKEINSRSGGTDHFRQSLLAYLRDYAFRSPFLAKAGEKQKNSC
jgi:hypothetical protein